MLLRELSISLLFAVSVLASEPYCDQNITEIVEVPVLKTRQKLLPRKGVFGFLKKKTYVSEEYVVMEKQTVQRTRSGCCEGYYKSEMNICEPVCKEACPQNARCVEPNRCQCNDGYMSFISKATGLHSCEPICSTACRGHEVCTAPDVCECKRGYRRMDNQCTPHCHKGHVFKEGTCIPCFASEECCSELDQCMCSEGSVWSSKTRECEEATDTTTEEYEITTEDDFFEDSDFESTSSPDSDSTDIFDDVTREADCPEGFLYLYHECRPKVFSSDEADCRFNPCPENGECQKNGTCTCLEGFVRYPPAFETEAAEVFSNRTKFLCLTLGDVEARTMNGDDDDVLDWPTALYIALGVIVICTAIILLLIKLVFVKRGTLDVEATNDLYDCRYDNHEKSVIL